MSTTQPRKRLLARTPLSLLLTLLLLAACGNPAVTPEPARLALHVSGQPADAPASVSVPFAGSRTLDLELTWPAGYEGAVELSVDAAALPTGVSLAASEASVGRADLPARLVFEATNAVTAADLGREVSVTITATTAEETPERGIETATLEIRATVRALVTSAADAGTGTLRELVGTVPTSAAGPTVIGFDPDVFGTPTSITLLSPITFGQSLEVRGPVDDGGAPLVELNGGGVSSGLVAVKDTLSVTLGSLKFTGSADHAIFNMGNLVVADSEVSGNGTYDPVDGWQIARGGGLYSTLGTLTLSNSNVTGNAAEDGGGIFVAGGALEVVDSTVEGNLAANGGGVYVQDGATARIVGSTVEGNTASEGGGIFIEAGAELDLDGSFLIANVADRWGGGVNSEGDLSVDASTISGNQAAAGGGVHVTSAGSLAVTGSLFYENVASGSGGGIFTNGPATFLNSTIAGNRAGNGGGIFSSAGGNASAELRFSTVAWNVSAVDGGGIYAYRQVELGATIVAENSAGSDGPDIFRRDGIVISAGHNLLGDDSDAGFAPQGNDRVNTLSGLDDTPGAHGSSRPQVLAFADPSSPAVDHVPPAFCTDLAGAPLTTDQRGSPRPGNGSADGRCDIGAFEVTGG